jgi:hypothetical protein
MIRQIPGTKHQLRTFAHMVNCWFFITVACGKRRASVDATRLTSIASGLDA